MYVQVSKNKAIHLLHQAIAQLDNMPEDCVVTLSVDLSLHGCSPCVTRLDLSSGEKIINDAATRIFSGDEFTSQLNLYDVYQSDIFDIKAEGVLKTILLPGIC